MPNDPGRPRRRHSSSYPASNSSSPRGDAITFSDGSLDSKTTANSVRNSFDYLPPVMAVSAPQTLHKPQESIDEDGQNPSAITETFQQLALRSEVYSSRNVYGKVMSVVTFCSNGQADSDLPARMRVRPNLGELARRNAHRLVSFTDLLFAPPAKVANQMMDAALITLADLTPTGSPPPWIEMMSTVEFVLQHCARRMLEGKILEVAHVFLAAGLTSGSSARERHVLQRYRRAMERLAEPLVKLQEMKNNASREEKEIRRKIALKICESGLFVGSLRKTGHVAQILRSKIILEFLDALEEDLNKILYDLYMSDTLDHMKTEHVHPTSRPWNVPLPQDKEFVGHEDLLTEMYRFLHGQAGTKKIRLPTGSARKDLAAMDPTVSRTETLLLWGLNGMGKTEVCVEYAYRNALDYSAVFWVDCDPDPDEEFSLLADELEMSMDDSLDLDQRIQKVREKLEDGMKYLLILDNVLNFEHIEDICPRYGEAHVLITSNFLMDHYPSVKIDTLPYEDAKTLMHLVEIEKAGFELDEPEMRLVDQIATLLELHPMALDVSGHIMMPKKPPEHSLTPGQLVARLKQGLDKPTEKKRTSKVAVKRQQTAAIDKFVSEERFLRPSALKNLFDAGLETLIGVGTLLDVASHYAHGELAIAILETGGWFGPQEIPLPLVGIAARMLRPVKEAGSSLSSKVAQYWEDITDRLAGRTSLDDDEDSGTDSDLLLSIEKLERLGLVLRNETSNGITFHRLVQEYARCREGSLKAADAVFRTLLGARCSRKTVDHFSSMWERRGWLEAQGRAPEEVFLLGFRLADHWAVQMLHLKVTRICDEAMARGKVLGSLRFRFWQLRNSLLMRHNMDAAMQEMSKCLRQMPRELAQGALGLLVDVEIMFCSVKSHKRTLSDVMAQSFRLEGAMDALAASTPARDVSGPYRDLVENGPGEVLSMAVKKLSFLHFESDLRPDHATRLLRKSLQVRLDSSGPRDVAVMRIKSRLGMAYTRLLFLSFLHQFLHDAFRIVDKGLPKDLMRGDLETVPDVDKSTARMFLEISRLKKEEAAIDEKILDLQEGVQEVEEGSDGLEVDASLNSDARLDEDMEEERRARESRELASEQEAENRESDSASCQEAEVRRFPGTRSEAKRFGTLIADKAFAHWEEVRKTCKVLHRVQGFRIARGTDLDPASFKEASVDSLYEREFEDEAQSEAIYEGLVASLWPRGNQVLGDVHFSRSQREVAVHLFQDYLSHQKLNPYSLESAYTRARIVLTERQPGSEGEEALRGAHRQLEEAMGEAEMSGLLTADEKLNSLICMALILDRLDRLDEAQVCLDRCLQLIKASSDSSLRQPFLYSWLLIKRGKLKKARETIALVSKNLRQQGYPRLGTLAMSTAFQGAVEWLQGHPEAAQGYLQDACQLLAQELGPDSLRVSDLLSLIGRMQLARGHDIEGAIVTFRHVLRIHERHLEKGHPALAYSMADLALAIERLDREHAVRQIKRQAIAYRQVQSAGEREKLAEILVREAVKLIELRRKHGQEVKELKTKALDIISQNESLPELRRLRKRIVKKQHLTEAEIAAVHI